MDKVYIQVMEHEIEVEKPYEIKVDNGLEIFLTSQYQ